MDKFNALLDVAEFAQEVYPMHVNALYEENLKNSRRKREVTYEIKEACMEKDMKRRVACMEKDIKRKVGYSSSSSSITMPPPDMMKNIEKKKGIDVKLITEKKLTKTDTSQGHNRLLISKKNLKNKFLTSAESDYVERKKGELIVEVMDPVGRIFELTFKQWEMKKKNDKRSYYVFVFITKWMEFVIENNLNDDGYKNKRIQLWSFRIPDRDDGKLLKLAFVINIIDENSVDDNNSDNDDETE